MSTTVCSSTWRRYEPLRVAVTSSYFAVFSYYMHWLIYSGSHLYILVRFSHHFCVCMPSAYFLCRFFSNLFCLCMRTLSWFFQRFCSSISGIFYSSSLIHFVVDFRYFSRSNIICYTQVLYPHGIYLLLVAI